MLHNNIKSSVKEEVILGFFGGLNEDISEIFTELSVVSGSEGLECCHEVLGDDFAVHDDVFVDEFHVSLWALSNFDDVVEGVPVSDSGVNSLAGWESLLDLLDDGNGGDGSTDEFLIVFGLEGIFDHLDILIGDEGSLVHFVDADEEVGEVEGSNFGSLQETLDDLSDHLGINFFNLNWEILDSLELMSLLGGFFEDFTHLLTVSEVVFVLVSSGGLSSIENDAHSVDFEVFLENFEVFHWVGNHIDGRIETLEVEGVGINGFACWETFLEFLSSTNDSNDGTNEVAIVLGLDSCLNGLEGDIEHKGGLIFKVNALEEGLKVEVSTESGKDSSESFSDHLLLLHLSDLFPRSKKGLGGSLTNLVSEVRPFLGFVISDRCFDFTEDLDTVDQEVLTNMISESGWAFEDSSHLLKLLPVSLDVRAVGHTSFDCLDKIGNICKTSNNVLGILLLEVFNSGLNVGDDVLSILDALGNIIESFGVEGSLEETTNDVFNLLFVNLDLVVFGGGSAEEESKSVFVHLKVG